MEHGINRSREIVRLAEGPTTKVINGWLRRNIEFGRKFVVILDQLKALQEEIADS
ncbi:MAG: hypothetical protein ABFS02_14480 [Pseudomonadota bacterium]